MVSENYIWNNQHICLEDTTAQLYLIFERSDIHLNASSLLTDSSDIQGDCIWTDKLKSSLEKVNEL